VSNPFDFSAEAAATDQELRFLLEALKGKSFEELKAILPPETDREHLRELIAIVNQAAGANDRVASLRSQLGKMGGAAVTLLKAAL
jgi:hypothetical protein